MLILILLPSLSPLLSATTSFLLFLGKGKFNLDLFSEVWASFESFLGGGKFSLKLEAGSSGSLLTLSGKKKKRFGTSFAYIIFQNEEKYIGKEQT